MFPQGLKLPRRDAFRDALPSDVRPADYPSRLPFLANQAMSYAASEDLAACTWPALPAGEHLAQASRPGLRGMVTGVRNAIASTAGFRVLGPPAALVILDDLMDRLLVAATESGWELSADAPTPFPSGWRHVTLTRPGERMEVMALPSPTGPVLTALSTVAPNP